MTTSATTLLGPGVLWTVPAPWLNVEERSWDARRARATRARALPSVLARLARAQAAAGQQEAAKLTLLEAIGLASTLDHRDGVTLDVLLELARASALRGQTRAAADLLRVLWRDAYPRKLGVALEAATMLAALHPDARGLTWATVALHAASAAKTDEARRWVTFAQVTLGDVFLALGLPERAERAYAKALRSVEAVETRGLWDIQSALEHARGAMMNIRGTLGTHAPHLT
ncbi:hypothetical protein [Deinococcus pimensis]|uniref:hypothetical protein n=1 Tax=Deinococcus pimensis TaxID=309888 RepID=UPI00047FF3F8|nr:hypothetical protein [Deinococcus pimensis]